MYYCNRRFTDTGGCDISGCGGREDFCPPCPEPQEPHCRPCQRKPKCHFDISYDFGGAPRFRFEIRF